SSNGFSRRGRGNVILFLSVIFLFNLLIFILNMVKYRKIPEGVIPMHLLDLLVLSISYTQEVNYAIK
ncbi:MAG: hypothetical protein KHY93_15115, partial [Clostridiales bacterium]|nr:hypothetical protein [Clostridiales bacterium]